MNYSALSELNRIQSFSETCEFTKKEGLCDLWFYLYHKFHKGKH